MSGSTNMDKQSILAEKSQSNNPLFVCNKKCRRLSVRNQQPLKSMCIPQKKSMRSDGRISDDQLSLVDPKSRKTKDNSLHNVFDSRDECNQQYANLLECEEFKDLKKPDIQQLSFQHMNWVNQRDQIALQYFKEQNKKIQENLKNTKIFLNMVIHDLRSPALQINFSYDLTHQNLATMYEWTHRQQKQWRGSVKQTHASISELLDQLNCNIQKKDQVIRHYKNQVNYYQSKTTVLKQELRECQSKLFDEIRERKELEKRNHMLIRQVAQLKSKNQQNNSFRQEKQDIQDYLAKIKNSIKLSDSLKEPDISYDLNQSLDYSKEHSKYIFQESPNGQLSYFEHQADETDSAPSSFEQELDEDFIQTEMIQFSSDVRGNPIQISQMTVDSVDANNLVGDQMNTFLRESQIINDDGDQSDNDATKVMEKLQTQLDGMSQLICMHKEIQQICDQNILDSTDILLNCKHNSKMMNTLLDDLLDLAKQEQLTFQLNTAYFNLIEAIKKSFNNLQFLAQQKEINLQLIVNKHEKPFFQCMYGDESRFEQILMNFVSNALKFSTKKSTVKIELQVKKNINATKNYDQLSKFEKEKFQKLKQELHETTKHINDLNNDFNTELIGPNCTQDSSNEITQSNQKLFSSDDIHFLAFEILIIDKGPGISEDGLNKLFMNFQSLKEHSNANSRGTGLGLSICKQLISKMGGNVSVHSIVGQGSTFKIQINTICQVRNDTQHSQLKTERRHRNYSKEFLRERFSNKGLQSIIDPINSPQKRISKQISDNTSESSQDNSSVSYDISQESVLERVKEKNKLKQNEDDLERDCQESELTAQFRNGDESSLQLSQQLEKDDKGIEKETISFEVPKIHRNVKFDKRSQSLRPSHQTHNPMIEQLRCSQESRRYTINDKQKTIMMNMFSSKNLQSVISFNKQSNLQNQGPDQYQASNDSCKCNAESSINKTLNTQVQKKQYLSIIHEDTSSISQNDQILSNPSKNNDMSYQTHIASSETFLSQQSLNNNSQKFIEDLKVLIVNDELMQVKFLEMMFKNNLGFTNENIFVAYGGLEAIDISKTIKNLDLVVMDLQMPDLDGFQTSQKIRHQLNRKDTKDSNLSADNSSPYIIAVTAGLIYDSLVESCKQSGINDQFSSPITHEDIKLRVIPNLLKQKRSLGATSTSQLSRKVKKTTKKKQVKKEKNQLNMTATASVFNQSQNISETPLPQHSFRTKTSEISSHSSYTSSSSSSSSSKSGSISEAVSKLKPQIVKGQQSQQKALKSNNSDPDPHQEASKSQICSSTSAGPALQPLQNFKRHSILNSIDFNMIPQATCESCSSSEDRLSKGRKEDSQ